LRASTPEAGTGEGKDEPEDPGTGAASASRLADGAKQTAA
jgi:hypothetical protein